jgi:HlyD family secretion protein
MKRIFTVFLIAAAAVAFAAFFVINWTDGEGASTGDSVRQAVVKRADMIVAVSATGAIVPRSEAKLSFDSPGKVSQVVVEVGDEVAADDELALLDDAQLAFQAEQARAALDAAQAQLRQLTDGARDEEVAISEANLDAAEATLAGAEANLREMKNSPDPYQVEAAQANLRTAQANLQLAMIQLEQITDGATSAEIAAAEAQVASAFVQQKVARDTHDQTMKCQTVTLPDGKKKEVCPALGTIEEQARFNLYAADEAYEAAQAQLDQILAGPTQAQIGTGNTNVAASEAQRDAAQAQLDQLLAGPSLEQLQAAQANVDALKAQRDAAQAQLDLLLSSPSASQMAAAQANVDQAQVALDRVLAELEKATLRAPFDGIVTEVNVKPAQLAPASLPAVTVVDNSEFWIEVNVDEIDVARIVEGQDVAISVDALPEVSITGRVERVAPAASQLGGVVVYKVTIVLDETDLPLRVGMSATADITTQELENVLLVPNWAIRIDRDTGHTFVNLLTSDQVQETEVTIGARGEDFSQVLSALNEGDIVVAGDVAGLRTLLERGD